MKIRARKQVELEAKWAREAAARKQAQARTAALDAKIERMEAEEERRYQQQARTPAIPVFDMAKWKQQEYAPPSTSHPGTPTSGTHNFSRKPKPVGTSLSKPWWQRARDWLQQNIVQPVQDFVTRSSEPPNASGPLFPKLQTATTTLTLTGWVFDRLLTGGRLTQSAVQFRQSADRFLQHHPSLQNALHLAHNLADFGFGFGSQVADDLTFGLYGRLTGLQWSNGSQAFQAGRWWGRVATNTWGQVELAAGLALAAASLKFIPPTAGGAATCAALSGGGCLLLGGAALAIETAGVLAGTAVAAHGGAMLMRNAGNPVGKGDDPTLRYGSNTGNTGKNAELLRQNMEEAGIQAPPKYEAHHIVPSRSQNYWAVQARKLLWEKFHIDINAAENGVFVPKSVNLRLNNKTYMEAVYKALEKADNREKAIEILQDIAEQIRLTGNYP